MTTGFDAPRRLATAIALAAALGAGASAVPGPAVEPLSAAALDAAAARGRAQLVKDHPEPLLFETHRRQAFAVPLESRGSGGSRRSLAVLSLAWWPQADGDSHCALVVDDGRQAQVVDALATEQDVPWACDGEPALRFADVTGDGCVDVVALYPYRPPSGERFWQPLVLRCQPGEGWMLDAERTRWLGDPAQRATGLTTLAGAMRLLGRYRAGSPPR